MYKKWLCIGASDFRPVLYIDFNIHACICVCYQNAELLSSIESASVRILKPPSASALSAVPRFQPSGPLQTSSPPVQLPTTSLTPTAPVLLPTVEPPRMATIQEDPSYDSHLDELVLGEEFPSPGSAPRSFEDLTDSPEKALSFRMKRHRNSKETEC